MYTSKIEILFYYKKSQNKEPGRAIEQLGVGLIVYRSL
jgi:hypothetical protein